MSSPSWHKNRTLETGTDYTCYKSILRNAKSLYGKLIHTESYLKIFCVDAKKGSTIAINFSFVYVIGTGLGETTSLRYECTELHMNLSLEQHIPYVNIL